MNYLAFDLGTHCGAAMSLNGEITYLPIDNSSGGKFASDAFYLFHNEVYALIVDNEIESVFIEKPHAGKFFHATRILFGLMGVLEKVCQEADIPYTYYSPNTIKKYWTGDGHAKKPAMLKATRERGFFGVKDHNVSDALALLHYGMEQN